MGKSLQAEPGTAQPPHRIRMTMTCEGDHGMFRPAPTHMVGEDYIVMRQQAAEDGWHYHAGKLLGPCCTKA
jgi:hypothetical protein